MIILLILLILLCFGGTIFLINHYVSKTVHTLKEEMGLITNKVGIHLEQTARLSQQAGEGTIKAIGDVYRRLGTLEEASNKIFEVGQEIGKLQDVLRAPKARGNFGELMLADLLGQVIPRDRFQLQYSFRNGARVDAVIFVGNYIVPIDSKFPLENFQRLLIAQSPEEKKKTKREFNRDVKRHIDVISERYIVQDEGTFDFALMYIPAENVHYEVIASEENIEQQSLSAYALEHRVIPVSPNSFYAYLQVILLGLRGLRLDHAAREISETLSKMQNDFKRISEDYSLLGTHLNHARGTYDKLQKGVDQFQLKLGLVDQIKYVEKTEKELLPTERGN